MYENLKGKRLLFLGGIQSLCDSVRYAKEMGIYTVVTDYLPNSPAKKVADKACMVSTTDVDAICQLCKDEHIDGLFTAFMDGMLPYARKICDRMGWPFYATEEQIRLSHDKSFFRAKCMEFGVPCPVDYTHEVLEKGIDEADLKFPLIVKPVDMYGGRGITIVRDRAALREAYEYATKMSPSRHVIIEEYMEGTEVTVVYTMKDGEYSLSVMKDKLISQDHENIQSLADVLMQPSRFLSRYVKEVDPSVKHFLCGVNAVDGVVFMQGIASENRIAFFELGYRPNGGCDYRHISRDNGINYIKMMIAHALTGKMDGYDLSMDDPFFEKISLNYNIFANPGIIGKMEGLEEILKLDSVDSAEYLHLVGDEITAEKPLLQRVFRAAISDKDIDVIKETIRKIQSLVKVKDVNGNDMLYKPFDVTRLDNR